MAGQVTSCEHVLVVDDDRDTVETLCEALQVVLGLDDVRYAMSMAEADQLLESGFRPSVIVLDPRVGGEDDVRFALRLRADPKYASIPTLLLSADPQRLACFREPFQRALLKPVELEKIVRAVVEVTRTVSADHHEVA